VVDLPVQRDAYGIPTIYSSSLKGALRSMLENNKNICDGVKIDELFGTQDSKGKVNFLDSTLLIFPARSLKGVVIGVTTPLLIERHLRLLRDLGICSGSSGLDGLDVGDNDAMIIMMEGYSPDYYVFTIGDGGRKYVVINEVAFNPIDPKNNRASRLIGDIVGAGVFPYKGVAVVNDNWLRPLLKKSLEYRTRIRLDSETKRPVGGALWTEELIPPGTIFSTYLVSDGPDSDGCSGCLDCLEELLRKGVFIGGKESVGSGLIRLLKVGCDG